MTLEYPYKSFLGRTLKSREAGPFVFTENVYPHGLRLAEHAHESACFVLVLRGTFAETYGRHSRTGRPSTLIYRPAGEPHSENFDGGDARCLNVEIGREWFEHDEKEVPLDSSDYRSPLLSSLSARLYREFRAPDALSRLAMEGLMLEIICAVSRASSEAAQSGSNIRLERAREFIHAHFTECLTIKKIANMIGVHPVHLAREFRKRYHASPSDYIARLRVEMACRELRDPEARLARIASDTGFYDQSHFSKTFKRWTGMTPAEYRAAVFQR